MEAQGTVEICSMLNQSVVQAVNLPLITVTTAEGTAKSPGEMGFGSTELRSFHSDTLPLFSNT